MKRLGKEHQDTLDSACNLGSCLRSLGKVSEAKVLFEAILETQRAFWQLKSIEHDERIGSRSLKIEKIIMYII